MTCADQETRLFATHHLGRLLHLHPNLQEWALELLITQLYDTAIEVCDVAVMYLEEVGSDGTALEKVVEYQPCLEHLDDIGYPLFMRYVSFLILIRKERMRCERRRELIDRFVSTSVGFTYLHRANYIDQEMDSWISVS